MSIICNFTKVNYCFAFVFRSFLSSFCFLLVDNFLKLNVFLCVFVESPLSLSLLCIWRFFFCFFLVFSMEGNNCYNFYFKHFPLSSLLDFILFYGFLFHIQYIIYICKYLLYICSSPFFQRLLFFCFLNRCPALYR